MFKLNPEQYGMLAPVFRNMDFHLSTQAILAGATHGLAWLDDLEKPGAGLLGHFPRYYLAGLPEAPTFIQALKTFFTAVVLPETIHRKLYLFILYYDSPAWEPVLEQVLDGFEFHKLDRQYYEIAAQRVDWKPFLPEGFTFKLADRSLFEDPQISGLEALRQEMCSERDSVDEFLNKSFGLVPVYGSQLAGWCLSEYNLSGRCEIGIATLEPFQRRGLATASTLAFLDLALQKGYRRIGWHCFTHNTPSVATARKAGLKKITDYSIYLVKVKI